jgi:hypothetical protein
LEKTLLYFFLSLRGVLNFNGYIKKYIPIKTNNNEKKINSNIMYKPEISNPMITNVIPINSENRIFNIIEIIDRI